MWNTSFPERCGNLSVLRTKSVIIGVCGWSGAGKTTLIEAALPELKKRGLKILVIKHDVHGINIDPEGKDSARLFDAGADVLLSGEGQQMYRRHVTQCDSLIDSMKYLSKGYDLILLEGHKALPVEKVWLAYPGETVPPDGCRNVLAVLERGGGRIGKFLEIIYDRLEG